MDKIWTRFGQTMGKSKRKFIHPFYLELLKKLVILEFKGQPNVTLTGSDFEKLSKTLEHNEGENQYRSASGSLRKIFSGKRNSVGVNTLDTLAIFAKFKDFNSFCKAFTWTDDISDKPYHEQDEQIKSKIDNAINSIIQEKIKKEVSQKQTSQFDDNLSLYFNKIIGIGKAIEVKKSLIKLRHKESNFLKKEVVQLEKQQDDLIQYIEHTIQYDTNKITDTFIGFVAQQLEYSYYSDRNKNLALAKKIYPIANLLRQLIIGEDKLQHIQLKRTHYKTGFSLDLLNKKERELYAHELRNDLKSVKISKHFPPEEFDKAMQQLFGFGSFSNPEFMSDFSSFCEDFKGNAFTKSYLKVNFLQCKACYLIRNNMNEVENWLSTISVQTLSVIVLI